MQLYAFHIEAFQKIDGDADAVNGLVRRFFVPRSADDDVLIVERDEAADKAAAVALDAVSSDGDASGSLNNVDYEATR